MKLRRPVENKEENAVLHSMCVKNDNKPGENRKTATERAGHWCRAGQTQVCDCKLHRFHSSFWANQCSLDFQTDTQYTPKEGAENSAKHCMQVSATAPGRQADSPPTHSWNIAQIPHKPHPSE